MPVACPYGCFSEVPEAYFLTNTLPIAYCLLPIDSSDPSSGLPRGLFAKWGCFAREVRPIHAAVATKTL